MDKEEVILKLKQLGYDLHYEKITYEEYKDQIEYLIRYEWKGNKSYTSNSNYFN